MARPPRLERGTPGLEVAPIARPCRFSEENRTFPLRFRRLMEGQVSSIRSEASRKYQGPPFDLQLQHAEPATSGVR